VLSSNQYVNPYYADERTNGQTDGPIYMYT